MGARCTLPWPLCCLPVRGSFTFGSLFSLHVVISAVFFKSSCLTRCIEWAGWTRLTGWSELLPIFVWLSRRIQDGDLFDLFRRVLIIWLFSGLMSRTPPLLFLLIIRVWNHDWWFACFLAPNSYISVYLSERSRNTIFHRGQNIGWNRDSIFSTWFWFVSCRLSRQVGRDARCRCGLWPFRVCSGAVLCFWGSWAPIRRPSTEGGHCPKASSGSELQN